MKLEEQIEILEEIGFEFVDPKHVHHILDFYDWWEYTEAPFTFLLERIKFWAACDLTRVCRNLISWDFKHLWHNGWYKAVAQKLAQLSSNATRLKIVSVTSSREADTWEMTYRLPSENGPVMRNIATRYPYKHASRRPVLEMAKDFENRTHCFVNFDDTEPSLCWLPKNKIDKLREILPDQFQPITKNSE